MASEQEVCVCICVDQRFHGWQRSGTVSHRQPFRNVPQPRDGLWSLISRAPSPRALSAYVRHRPSQMHAGGAAASCESFPALSIFLSLRVTPGWQSVVLDGFFISLLVWILKRPFTCLVTCLIVCMWTCLTAFACECICFSDFFPPISTNKHFQLLIPQNSSTLLDLHTVSTLWMTQSLFHH